MRPNSKHVRVVRNKVDMQPFKDCVPEAVYWLGYLYANASVIEPKRGSLWLNVICATAEENHLRRLALYTNVKPTILYTREGKYASIRIRDTNFVNFCLSIGIARFKKDRASVSQAYTTISAFWRGLFDANAWAGGIDELHVSMPKSLAGQLLDDYADQHAELNELHADILSEVDVRFSSRHDGTYAVVQLIRMLYTGIPIADVSPSLQGTVSNALSMVVT